MEPFTGSAGKEHSNVLLPSINHHHGKASKSTDRSLYHTIDSGYVSSYNVTPYNTPNASSNSNSSSIISTPQRFGNNSNLITIPEISDGNKLTPVTQNIRKINDFHITTPKSQDFAAAGAKRTALYFEEYQSTPKKLKLENSSEDSAIKSVANTPRRLKKPHLHKRSFRYKLASAPDFEDVDTENFFSSQNNDLSPIGSKPYDREKRTPLAHANVNLQSSTPKSCGYRPKVTAIDAREKAHAVKKLLSFSDQQFQSLLNSKVKPVAPICEEEKADSTNLLSQPSPTRNSVSKSTGMNYGALTETAISSNSTSTISKANSLQEYKNFLPVFSVLKDREMAKRKFAEAGLENLKIIKNTKTVEKIPTIKSEHQTTSKAVGFQDILKISPSSTHMEISPLKPNEESSADKRCDYAIGGTDMELTSTQSNVFLSAGRKFHYDIDGAEMEITPLKHKQPCAEKTSNYTISSSSLNNYTIKADDDIRVDRSIVCDLGEVTPLKPRRQSLKSTEQQAHEIDDLARLPRTPKKQKLHFIEQERVEILYPTIPYTPSKSLANSKVLHKKKFSERKLEKKPRKFYDGITFLNIIAKLEPYTLVLEQIFELLSSQDLLNLIHTSRSFRRIVRSHSRANDRLKRYLEACNLSKENNGEYKVYSVAKSSIRAKDVKGAESLTRAPFAQSNKNDRKRSLTILHSPPVSPSKRKFHENQKVVRTLQDNEKLTKCPRCSKSSRIIETPLLPSGQNNKSRHFESFHSVISTLRSISNEPDTGDNNNAISLTQPTSNVPTAKVHGKLVKSASMDSMDSGIRSTLPSYQRRLSLPFRPYAECTGLACGFQFCLECLCEYHPGSRCKVSDSLSPSKEDLQNGILQLSSSVSRSLKNRRKSLKRLCF